MKIIKSTLNSLMLVIFLFMQYPLAAGHPDTPSTAEIKQVLDKIKDHLVQVTPYHFYDRISGEKITGFTQLSDAYAAELPGGQSIWTYEVGVINSAMVLCTRVSGDSTYLDYAERTYQFFFDHLDYIKKLRREIERDRRRLGKMVDPRELDDCGSMGAALIKLDRERPDNRYREIINLIADFISNKQLRLEDGTFARKGYGDWQYSLWTNDLYMSVPFLAQMGHLTGDNRYYDDAVRQVLNFAAYLFVAETGLFDHGWFSNMPNDPHIYWGRQNGWAMMAIVELLSVLPDDYPGRDKILAIYQADVKALTHLQGNSGLWHQLLDRTDTYPETSCSAMYAFAIARGVNREWIAPQYASVAFAAWKALVEKVTADGQIAGVCMGTSLAYDVTYYVNRPQKLTAYHGYGPMLSAGAELMQLLKNFDVREKNRLDHYWRK